MSAQNPNQGGASRGQPGSGQSDTQQGGGAQREAQQQGKQGRDSKETPRTEPTHPSSSDSERADRSGDSEERSQRGGEQGREAGPRFDDRPEPRESDREGVSREQNEGSAGSTTRPGQQSGEREPKSTPGLPNYGDRESNDPRRIDVESEGSEERE